MNFKNITNYKYFINFILLVLPTYAVSQNKVRIPDAAFKAFLVEHFDSDGDGEISESEALSVTRMSFSTVKISSIEGIEYFKSLEELDCSPSDPFEKGLLTSFDISGNTKLKKLYCNNNQLDTLDLHQNTMLVDLHCQGNALKSLDVSRNTLLEELICDNNKIEFLDVSMCNALTYLNCSRNNIDSLNVNGCDVLRFLNCADNNLLSLDISNNPALWKLNCAHNELTKLDVCKNPKLNDLDCGSNRLDTLDVSNNAELSELECSINKLTSLNVTHNEKLKMLYCNAMPTLTDIFLRSGNDIRKISYSKELASLHLVDEFGTVASTNFQKTGDSMAFETPPDTEEDLKAKTKKRRRKATLDVDKETVAKLAHRSTSESGTSISDSKRAEVMRMAMANRDYAKNMLAAKEAKREEYRLYSGLISIPDSAFNAYLVSKYDTNSDRKISGQEVRAVKSLDCSGLGILSLQGIEYFTSLESLNCNHNKIQELDLSFNPSLKSLDCSFNKLHSLELRDNAQLTKLICSVNNLVVIDVSKNTELRELRGSFIRLIELDITNNTKLTTLECGYNHLEMLDTHHNLSLDTLICNDNKLKVIDIKHLKNLAKFNCAGNQMTSVNVLFNTALKEFNCSNNQMQTIDVSRNTSLITLDCGNNLLRESVDLSNNKIIENYYIYGNKLTFLDVNAIPSMKHLKCMDNSMTELDIRSHPSLKSVELAPMPSLKTLRCKSIFYYTSLTYPYTTKVDLGKE